MSTTRARRSKQFVVGRRHPVVVDIGCGCRPRPKLFLPSFLKLSSKPTRSPLSSMTTTTMASSTTTTTFSSSSTSSSSPHHYHYPNKIKQQVTTSKNKNRHHDMRMPVSSKAESAAGGGMGVAVVKDSSDPYVDFRESMVQMILEMELFEWEELRALLRRLLALNAPRHHHAILTAFAEIWAELVAPPAPAMSAPAMGYRR